MKTINRINYTKDESIGKYFKDLKSYKILSVEEEFELVIKYKEHNDFLAREKILKANLRFVVSCAKSFKTNPSKLPLEDLIGYGNIGLCNALEKFDYKKGFKFITYAVWHIKQQIVQSLQKNQTLLRVPSDYPAILQRVNNEVDIFYTKNQRKPELDELIDLGLINHHDSIAYRDSFTYNNCISINDTLSNKDTSIQTYEDILYNEKDNEIENIIINSDNNHTVLKLLNNSNLKSIEKIIIKKRFGVNNQEINNVNQISDEMKITKTKIDLITKTAINKMKSKFLR